MTETPIIVSGIIMAKKDTLVPGHPYIPTVPRIAHSVALVTDGSLRYTVNGHAAVVSAGEVLFIKNGNIDIAESASEGSVSFYTVDFVTVSDAFDMDRRYVGSNDVLLPLFRRSTQRYSARTANWQMECTELLYRILNELRRSDSYTYHRIVPAMESIKNRLSDQTLTVTALAEVCGISVTTLNRIFRQLYGMPASRYLMSRRMETAKDLLLNATNTVGEVAERVGYGDIYTFSHAFSRFYGSSPQVWRKQPNKGL